MISIIYIIKIIILFLTISIVSVLLITADNNGTQYIDKVWH